jgi:hypothetical protein
MVRLQLASGHYVCSYDLKRGREHQIYWRIVKADQHFETDPFFTQNKSVDAQRGEVVGRGHDDNPEVAHRDWVQYTDHIVQIPSFKPLDKEALKLRINRISDIRFDAPPIPRSARILT